MWLSLEAGAIVLQLIVHLDPRARFTFRPW